MTFFKVKGIYSVSRDDFPGYMQRFEKVAWIYGGKDTGRAKWLWCTPLILVLGRQRQASVS